MSLWYCEELDEWSSDPEDSTRYSVEDGRDIKVYTWSKGKKVNLANYIDAYDIFEIFDNNWDICHDDNDPPSYFVTKEQQEELENFLKEWAAKIDYNMYLYDPEGEKCILKPEELMSVE